VTGTSIVELQETKVPTLDWTNSSNYALNFGDDAAAYWSYGTPTSDLSRMGIASATSMSLLQGRGPSPNCSYQMILQGPALSCQTADLSAYTTFYKQLANWSSTSGDDYSTWMYFAWAGPDMPSMDAAAADFNYLDETSGNAAITNILFDQAAGSEKYAYIQCSLHNASYLLNFAFENSQQLVRVEDRTLLNGVSTNLYNFECEYSYGTGGYTTYESSGWPVSRCYQTEAYTQIMQVFNELLVGSILDASGLNDRPNALLITNTISMSTAFNYAGSLSNESMALLAENLFENITLSLLSSNTYTTNTSTTPSIPVSFIHARRILLKSVL